MNKMQVPQTQLWIGSSDNLDTEVTRYLQQFFCMQQGCLICATCKQIHNKQHYGALWITPEKGYTLDTLSVIQERIAFTLPDDQAVFFIVQKADFLTQQCANSLLKIIEEPPRGYHFILCAQRKEFILPTIISRCIIRLFGKQDNLQSHKTLYAYFTAATSQNPSAFLKEMQSTSITEYESLELVDQLLAYWIEQNMHMPSPKNSKKMQLFKQALLTPPMPGSSKLFWKNLFLQYYDIT